jgi:hypothetical protein
MLEVFGLFFGVFNQDVASLKPGCSLPAIEFVTVVSSPPIVTILAQLPAAVAVFFANLPLTQPSSRSSTERSCSPLASCLLT